MTDHARRRSIADHPARRTARRRPDDSRPASPGDPRTSPAREFLDALRAYARASDTYGHTSDEAKAARRRLAWARARVDGHRWDRDGAA